MQLNGYEVIPPRLAYVATLPMGGFVNYQIKKGLLLSVRVKKKLKSMNIWQSYKQKRDCLMHFARRANALLKDEESAPCI